MRPVLRIVGKALLLLVILFGLAVNIVPRFLDRLYYRGPVTAHFDGQRFFNPTGPDTGVSPTGRSRSGFLWRYLTGTDGRPPWPAHVAVTPSRPAARVMGERMVVTWIGHSTVLVQTNGLNILTDPIWSDKTGPWGLGPRRATEPGVRFEDLPRIDLVVVSHNHYDHMDLPTLKRLWDRDKPLIVTSLGNDTIIRSAGIWHVSAVDWGGVVRVSAACMLQAAQTDQYGTPASCRDQIRAQVVVVRAHHWGTRYLADRNRALWSGFVVRLPRGGNLFFAGDTGRGDGKWPAEAAAYGPIRLALLPIGAFRFSPGQMGIAQHMGPVDAVRAFSATGAGAALPVHWGTFRQSYEAFYTPPRMLAMLMACVGAAPGRFAGHAIGVPFEAPPVTAAAPPLDLRRLDACAASRAVQALQ